jgi:hypothetical protein
VRGAAGRLEEASALHERATAIFERAFGSTHPETLAARANDPRRHGRSTAAVSGGGE